MALLKREIRERIRLVERCIEIVSERGKANASALARELDVSPMAVSLWKKTGVMSEHYYEKLKELEGAGRPTPSKRSPRGARPSLKDAKTEDLVKELQARGFKVQLGME